MHSDIMVNTTLHKTFHLEQKSLFSITDDEQHYIKPIDLEIMKCLVSKGGLYPKKDSEDCAHALYV